MNENFGKRLKSARKMAGLSLQGLADLLNGKLSKQAINKYEQGKMAPTSENLILLAGVLNVSIDYFFKAPPVGLGAVEFRKRSRLSQKVIDQIKEQSSDYLTRYLELENILGIDHHFETDLGKKIIGNREDAEDAAKQLRAQLELGEAPISNLTGLLEENGIKVMILDAPGLFDGLVAKVDQHHFMVINKNMDVVRKRFTMSHELGHLILNIDTALSEKEQENLCHAFANEFLLPQEVLLRELGRNRSHIALEELKSVKAEFGISIQAIAYKLKQLQVISEYAYKSFNIECSRKGWKKNEPGEFSPSVRIDRFNLLLERALAEELITFSKASSISGISIDELKEKFELAI